MRATRSAGMPVLITCVATLAALAVGPAAASPQPDTLAEPLAAPAPEFAKGLDWLNVPRPLAMTDLRGKIVLLDFWTYGSIDCLQVIPDLERLQREYPNDLAIVGVHCAKYPQESVTKNIGEALLRSGVTTPVVNDNDLRIWDAYGVTAWPTLVLVDPTGSIVDRMEGEGVYAFCKPRIQALVDRFSPDGLLGSRPLAGIGPRPNAPDSLLSFPGKVLADAAGGRLFVADSGHNRIVIADPATGGIRDVAGGGGAGLRDGSFADARFDDPQGMALAPDGRSLYVADAANHAIRVVDLADRTVVTFAGDGREAGGHPPGSGPAGAVGLDAPWDLALVGTRLFIAMAGSHQIWVADLDRRRLEPFAGTGIEGTFDGPRQLATLAQPGGLAWDGGSRLYFASTQGNTVRWVDLGAPGEVHTLAGGSDTLFDFGSVDGPAALALFQHPLGLAAVGGSLYVADTYNNRIRRIDVATGRVTTVSGDAEGWRDGTRPQYWEPGGIAVGPGGELVVADTDNQAVRLVDPATGSARTLLLRERSARAEAGAAPVAPAPDLPPAPPTESD